MKRSRPPEAPAPVDWRDAIRAAVARLEPAERARGVRAEVPVKLIDGAYAREERIPSVQGRRSYTIEGHHGPITCVALGPSELREGTARIRETNVSEWAGKVLAEIAL